MDCVNVNGVGDVVTAKNSKALNDVGSNSNKDVVFRADMIDFKSWAIQLEMHLSRVWSRDREAPAEKEDWEIDLSKLDIRYCIAAGTFGIVYRGVYDGHDVAVKVLDCGEDGIASAAEISALRASIRQEVAVWHKLDHSNVPKKKGNLDETVYSHS